MSELTLRSQCKAFGGSLSFYRVPSHCCRTEMNFSIFLPPAAEHGRVPVLYWLSGLTCTDENFMVKAGALRVASELGVALVAPDTSPRGLNLPGEDDDWDFGSGAGFYVNALREPWRTNYQMYDFVVEELPGIVADAFPVDRTRASVFGHSMGGHGALIVALRNPDRYRSVSAFSPIAAPSRCPWGQKAFGNYLGEDQTLWAEYDASELLAKTVFHSPILVDQGTDDPFLVEQLKPELLLAAAEKSGAPLDLRHHQGYDHGYYFIATFIEDHIRFHHQHLTS